MPDLIVHPAVRTAGCGEPLLCSLLYTVPVLLPASQNLSR